FYGLRPASIAMITAAGLNVARIALLNIPAYTESHSILSLFNWKGLVLAAAIFFGIKKLKWHPIIFLAISALIGILFKF
ncbi:MAG: chromate transporter, partial [Lachnospiraceae bacterium]|nr:chromate transporter [Lachnospiraceae bacterium]